MGIKYIDDNDLEFLQYCSEDDLYLLDRYMTHDENGKKRLTSDLLKNDEFCRHRLEPNQYKICWQLIAGELQHFGGDTFANLVRRKGVLYKEIISDVCSLFKEKIDSKNTTYEIENKLLKKLLSVSWLRMEKEQRSNLLKNVKLVADLSVDQGLANLKKKLTQITKPHFLQPRV